MSRGTYRCNVRFKLSPYGTLNLGSCTKTSADSSLPTAEGEQERKVEERARGGGGGKGGGGGGGEEGGKREKKRVFRVKRKKQEIGAELGLGCALSGGQGGGGVCVCVKKMPIKR